MSMLPLKGLGVLCISKPMGFGKAALPKAEKRYHGSKLEILALKLAFCNQFQDYFLYAPKVEVYTGNLFMFCHQQSLAQQVNSG